ncbi:MAG: carboxypeptidase regulatory-like domain-containing protein, partial [Acidobacteria bacterium]|nr:carboxypeptidase regulatory-like domain-containing protein [Acidobacteriota bacterium]
MRRFFLLLFAALLVGCLVPAGMRAQMTSGTVVVTVQDPSGAVVPNAKIALKSKDTGTTLRATTEAIGTARFPNVMVGAWTVEVEASGFKKFVGTLSVNLNTTTDVLAKMELGALAEVVEVGAAVESLVETTASQLGTSFTSEKITDLPIGSQTDLALLTPNTVHQGSGVLGAGGSIGGQRSRNNNFTIDGVDNN